jgi:transcriptional regulator with XRE-family HTH domain
MTSEHVRAARMLLRWDQKELAKKSRISLPTIKRLESQPGRLSAYADTIAAIRKTFEDEGIEFLDGYAPGVRLHKIPGSPGLRKRAAAPDEPVGAPKAAAGTKTASRKSTRQRRLE